MLLRLLLLIIVLCLPDYSWAAWTHVSANQNHGDAASGTTVASVLGGTSAPTVGNIVTCIVFYFGSAGTTATAQDENGKTYTKTTNSPSTYDVNAGQMFIFYRVASGGEGKLVTVTFSNTIGGAASIRQNEFSPASGTAAFDNDAKGTGTGTAINTPSVPVSGSDDLLVVGVGYSNGILSIDSPWTATVNSPGTFGEGYGYKLTANSATAAAMTGNDAGATWSSMGASFTIGGGGGPAVNYFRRRAQ